MSALKMDAHACFVPKQTATSFTFERLIICVYERVLSKLKLRLESFSALFAYEGLLDGMDLSDMMLQISFHLERFLTHITFKWSFE